MLSSSASATGSQAADNPKVKISLKTLIDLAPAAANLSLRKQHYRAQQSGGYVSRFKGRGMEFDESRLYQAGDDIRSIDWRVTARTGKPHTKIFREERERPVFISVDNRTAMQFGTRGVFKSVQAAKLAGLLAWAAQHHGDRIGGQIYSEQHCLELKPHNGKHAVLRFLNALVGAPGSSLSSMSLEHVLARLNQHTRPGSLVYLLSDFRGLSETAEIHLANLAQHCEVVLIFIYDELESALPAKGSFRFLNADREVLVDAANGAGLHAYHQRFLARREQLSLLAKQQSLGFLSCATNDDPIRCLNTKI